MRDDALKLILQLETTEHADAQEVDELAQRLRLELLQADVLSVEPVVAGEAPPGTRAADVAALGALLVTLTHSPDVLKAVVGAIQGWLHSQPVRTVELQIAGDSLKLSGVSSADQARLINLFVERHARGEPQA